MRSSASPTRSMISASNEEKREAAQALAEAARAKHRAVLDAVKGQLPAADQSEVQNVIDREAERTSPEGNPGRSGPGGNRPSNAPPKPTPKK